MNPPIPSKSLKSANKKWLNKTINCYIRSMDNIQMGPYIGYVRGISNNQAAVEDEGGKEYTETGLLVDISELGINKTYVHWPVRFDDVIEIIYS